MKRKEIKNYPDYFVSKDWEIASLKSGDRKIMRQTMSDKWYYKVWLYKNWKQYKVRVHRIIAITFISNPNWYPHINHKDFNRTNNKISNLEWCTRDQNYTHSKKKMIRNHKKAMKKLWGDDAFREKMSKITTERINKYRNDETKKKHSLFMKNKKRKTKQVAQHDLQHNHIKTYKSAKEAAKENGIWYYAWIQQACKNKRQHRGYFWSYVNP